MPANNISTLSRSASASARWRRSRAAQHAGSPRRGGGRAARLRPASRQCGPTCSAVQSRGGQVGSAWIGSPGASGGAVRERVVEAVEQGQATGQSHDGERADHGAAMVDDHAQQSPAGAGGGFGVDEYGDTGGAEEAHLAQVDDHRGGVVIQRGLNGGGEPVMGEGVDLAAYADDDRAGKPAGRHLQQFLDALPLTLSPPGGESAAAVASSATSTDATGYPMPAGRRYPHVTVLCPEL